MRKLCIIVTGLFCTLLFTTCKQYFADIEGDLSYWASVVTAGAITCDQPSQTIGGAVCIPSATDVTFTLKVRNPKNFTLVTPTSSADAGRVIRFPHLSPQPKYGDHYTLRQTASDTLTLVYKSAFLQQHEWGNGNIGAEITFISTDGRVFGDRFNLNIRADSAPVLESAGIGKTAAPDAGGDYYYVLLFRVKDMGATAAAGTPPAPQLRHKDLNHGKLIVTKDRGSPHEITLTFNAGNTDFTQGAIPGTTMELLDSGAVATLDPADPPLPSTTAQDWIIRLKTDVKVGGPEKLYEVCAQDTQGLRSALIPAHTKKTKLADVQLFDGSTPITGTTPGNPKACAGISAKTLTAQAAPPGAVITATVSRFTSAPGNWTQISGSPISGTTPVNITLPALAAGENQALYKISLKAALSGYEDSNPTDFFIKPARQEIPVLKLKQDFIQTGDPSLYCISAGTKAYVTEDIITDAGQYTAAHPLVIYAAQSSSPTPKLELSASAGTIFKYEENDSGIINSLSSTPAEIQLAGTGSYKIKVWAEKAGVEGPHTTVHFEVKTAVDTYTELKNVIRHSPEKGPGQGQYNYSNPLNIKIGGDLTASADTEIAITGGKKLMLSNLPAGTVRTVNAGGNGRIFKVSGVGTELTLENIKLTGGNAADGGAVHVETGGKLVLKGQTVITPSTGGDENTPGKNDVYLASGASIKVDGVLAATAPIVARITPQNYSEGTQVLIGSVVGSEYTKFTVTPQTSPGQEWKIDNTGKLKKAAAVINGSEPGGAWKKLKAAVAAAQNGDIIKISGEVTATGGDNSGKIDITQNITIEKAGGASSAVLNANRDSLGTNAHPIFRVSGGKTLTLKNLTLKGGQGAIGTFGGAINVTVSGSKAELENCIIEDCEAQQGGAIGCGSGTTVNLTDTTIQNCKAHTPANTGMGGAICAQGATVNITNCTLKGNEAQKNGGTIYALRGGGTAPSTVTVTGGTIGGTGTDANKATGPSGQGGGIYVSTNCTLTLQNNVQLIGNTAAKNGGAIYAGDATVNITNCTLKGNEAKSGGAVYAEKTGSTPSTVTISGGTIGGAGADANKATGSGEGLGGGIYIGDACSLTLQNNVQVTGNTADKDGGGVYAEGATVNITDCTLKGNEAKSGGAICGVRGGNVAHVTVTGGTIGGAGADANKATGSGEGLGGGIYISDGSSLTLQNNAQVTGNTAQKGTGIYVKNTIVSMNDTSHINTNNDVYLADAQIRADSALNPPGGITARITVPDNKYNTATQVLLAGSVTLANETYKFTVTPQTSPAQEWTVGGNGHLKKSRYREVPYAQLQNCLANASSTDVTPIELTGAIPAADLTGTYGSPANPGALGQKIKDNLSKKVALKLPSGLSVTNMDSCFAQCENLVSLENFPSGVTDMRACFYKCENLTTVPDIPATVTGMKECFRFCKSLTTALNIPTGVYDMTSCFQNCKKLQSVKMNCHYAPGNFNGAFSGCDALPSGGIQVLSAQLTTYKNNAGTMGTTQDKFAGF